MIETLVRATDAEQTRPKLNFEPGVAHIHIRGKFDKGTLVFSTAHVLQGQRAGHGDAGSRE